MRSIYLKIADFLFCICIAVINRNFTHYVMYLLFCLLYFSDLYFDWGQPQDFCLLPAWTYTVNVPMCFANMWSRRSSGPVMIFRYFRRRISMSDFICITNSNIPFPDSGCFDFSGRPVILFLFFTLQNIRFCR